MKIRNFHTQPRDLRLQRIFFVGLIFLSLGQPPEASFLDQGTKDLCNRVILNIYEEIEAVKDSYPELADFDRSVLSKNQYGISSIEYQDKARGSASPAREFAFGLTIVATEDTNFLKDDRPVINLGFPVLDLKFAGYLIRSSQDQFDLEKILAREGKRLWDHQQKDMPYRLALKSEKEAFHLGEDIEFSVTLTNLSNTNRIFKDLNSQTLFFLYGDREWGTWEVDPRRTEAVKDVILNSDESLTRKFRGPGSLTPKEFEIRCSYAMTYKGVQPSAVLKIKVVE